MRTDAITNIAQNTKWQKILRTVSALAKTKNDPKKIKTAPPYLMASVCVRSLWGIYRFSSVNGIFRAAVKYKIARNQ
jgi:hypothetical protein